MDENPLVVLAYLLSHPYEIPRLASEFIEAHPFLAAILTTATLVAAWFFLR
jgi:hypothetical protein